MTIDQLLDVFQEEADNDPRQAAINLSKSMASGWCLESIPDSNKLTADIAGVVFALNRRWQTAVGNSLKNVAKLASTE